jgi:hypothetical protein
VPDHLKYGLHQLFIRHGQQCFKCRKNTKPGTKAWENALECPLEHLLDRSKGNFGHADKEDDEEEMDEAIAANDATKATKKKAAKPKRVEKEADKGSDSDDAAQGSKNKIAKASKRGTKAQGTKNEMKEERDVGIEEKGPEKLPRKTNGKEATAERAAPKKTAPKKVAKAVAVDEHMAVEEAQGPAGKNYKFVNSTVDEQEVRSKIKSEVSQSCLLSSGCFC